MFIAANKSHMRTIWGLDTRRGTLAAALVAIVAGCAPAERLGLLVRRPELQPAPEAQQMTHDEAIEVEQKLERGQGKFVVVDLDHNELRFMDGETVVWSGLVGTGTGLRLRGENGEWDFSTPNGLFHVQFKELDPVWLLPDWYFVEHDLPIPPKNAPERRVPGGLGAAAVYLGSEIAIHGTDKPELLGQRVSHGCIRLADPNAMRLFHNVQIGTPVVIIGGENFDPDRRRETAAVENSNSPPDSAASPEELTTEELLQRLDSQIRVADVSADWTGTVSELIRRGLDDDAIALRAVLRRAGQSDNEAFEREYDTFVADAYSRGAMRAVVSLARIEEEERERAAAVIVRATMDLYPGRLDDPVAPWPTRRVAPWALGPEGTSGWEALAAAEEEYRTSVVDNRVVLQAEGR